MNWIKCSERMPDATKQLVAVYAPKGLYKDHYGYPSMHILRWYKSDFGDLHEEHMQKITHWMPLPDAPIEDEG